MHQLALEFYTNNDLSGVAFIVPAFSVVTNSNASRQVAEEYDPAAGEEVWRVYTRGGEVRFQLHKKA